MKNKKVKNQNSLRVDEATQSIQQIENEYKSVLADKSAYIDKLEWELEDFRECLEDKERGIEILKHPVFACKCDFKSLVRKLDDTHLSMAQPILSRFTQIEYELCMLTYRHRKKESKNEEGN